VDLNYRPHKINYNNSLQMNQRLLGFSVVGCTGLILARAGLFGKAEWTVPKDCESVFEFKTLFGTKYVAIGKQGSAPEFDSDLSELGWSQDDRMRKASPIFQRPVVLKRA